MLNTNVCIHLIRRRPRAVLRRFEGYTVGEIGVSSVTVAEFGQDAAAAYGRVRAALESGGTPIDPLDTLIAAHAVSLEVTLVTSSVREFGRVPGLEVEDWVGEAGAPERPAQR